MRLPFLILPGLLMAACALSDKPDIPSVGLDHGLGGIETDSDGEPTVDADGPPDDAYEPEETDCGAAGGAAGADSVMHEACEATVP